MSLIRLKQLDQDGAVDNDVVTWNAALGVWEPQGKASGIIKDTFANFGGNSATNRGDHNTVQVGANAGANVSFHFPEDFASITELEIVGIPVGTFVDQDIDLTSDYGAAGELYNQNSGADLASVYSGVADVFFAIDASAIFPGAAAGDYAGIRLKHNAIGTQIGYVGVHLRYLTL